MTCMQGYLSHPSRNMSNSNAEIYTAATTLPSTTHTETLSVRFRDRVGYAGAYVQVQCCFTSTKTIRTVTDGEPSTATKTFTQLLSSVQEHTITVLIIYMYSVKDTVMQPCL